MYFSQKLVVAAVASLAAPAAAFFKVPCSSPLVTERADPIVNPGKVAGHVHTIMGGNGFGFDMTFEQARASQCSTCKAKDDNSNYWVPSLYFKAQNGSFISVKQSGGMLIYYQQRLDDGQTESDLKAFPAGFRMLAGDPNLRSDSGTTASDAITYACLDYNGPATKETNNFPNRNCPSGLRAQIYFPSCWNGKDLDSPDHRSHMSYPSKYNGGNCPEGFKTRTVSLFYEVIWQTDKFANEWYGDSQPFVWSMGDPTGYGYHGDFVNGWNVDTLQKAISECKDGNDGPGHNGAIEYCPPLLPLLDNDVTQSCRIAPSINEQVDGVLEALPGCNPIQAGPGAATPRSDCDAPTTIGQPATYFTDLTESKKWAYVGCGKDVYNDRTLTGASTNDKGMTVETCIDFCSGKGFSVAGLEYSTECYCDNDIATDRAPVDGLLGSCTRKCSGDDSQFCGGGQQLSLYKKCDGACENAGGRAPGSDTGSAGSAPLASGAPAPGQTRPDVQVKAAETANPASDTGYQTVAAPAEAESTVAAAEPKPQPEEVPAGEAEPVPEGDAPGSSTSADPAAPTDFSAPTNSSSSVTLPEGWRDAGCYVDPVNPRALQYMGWFGEPMTSSGCAKYCDGKGYAFAGTENGGQCFCSNTVNGGQPADASECNMKCKGSDDETCGGGARLNLFTKLAEVSTTRLRTRAAHRRHLVRHQKEAQI
ncbi:MAG: hypothetical protein M1817_006015 [Caeruleum heppii]|nr:MAG: hypothetical protein M1817_006015 [Caeruleum heppii]